MLLNLLLIANAAIPRGGEIGVRLDTGSDRPAFTLTATGPMMRLPPKFLELHSGQRPDEPVDAHAVQPYFTLLLARETGMSIDIRINSDDIVLSARPEIRPD